MADGSLKRVADLNIGDDMAEGGRVYAVLTGDGYGQDWYFYGKTAVTGSHFVYEDEVWVPVEFSKHSVFIEHHFHRWFCVLNEKHRMLAEDGVLFTDFDAVDSVNEELEERLNAKSKES